MKGYFRAWIAFFIVVMGALLLVTCGEFVPTPTPPALGWDPDCSGRAQVVVFGDSYDGDPTPRFHEWSKAHPDAVVCSTQTEAFNVGKREHYSIMTVVFYEEAAR